MARKRNKITITVGEVAQVLDALGPPSLAQSWDNVGLLVGDRKSTCKRILLCIDLTPPVLKEAIRLKSDLVISYHPVLFKPIARILADSNETDAIVHQAIAHGIAIYSPHTALDAAPGGTNDVLALMCGLTEIEPFEYTEPQEDRVKVVTFAPASAVEGVTSAMSQAGAGVIGDYEQCSYRLTGEGTFFGTDATDPQVGQRGRLEKVAETRVEMVASRKKLPEVIDALLRAHPYEEVAYDIYPLVAAPTFGIGRVGVLKKGTTLGQLARKLKRATASNVTMIVGKPDKRIRRAAVCAGAAGGLPWEHARSAGCDVIVTGEIRHHDALTILRRNSTAIALGHWESERPILDLLAKRLQTIYKDVRTSISNADVGPFARV